MDYLGISQEGSQLSISIITKKRRQISILNNINLNLDLSSDVKRLYNLIYDGKKKILITGLSASVFVLKTFVKKEQTRLFKHKKYISFMFPFLKTKLFLHLSKAQSYNIKRNFIAYLPQLKTLY